MLAARLLIFVILQENESAFNLLGPVCSSWGIPNRGTSQRDYINWAGAQYLPYVAGANMMISRKLCGSGCLFLNTCTHMRMPFSLVWPPKGHFGNSYYDGAAYYMGSGTSCLLADHKTCSLRMALQLRPIRALLLFQVGIYKTPNEHV